MNDSRRKIALAGFGMEGRAVYELLKGSAELHIFDEREPDLSGVEAVFHAGLSIPEGFEAVYKSPGIPTSRLALASRETRIDTLMNLVLARVRDRAIGVTGTKGKSTVASLVHHVLLGAGRKSVLFGNIGIADVKLLDDADATFVIEMSSYQCEHVIRSPHIAVVTNFYPEHLSHHGSLERYRQAKLNIARFQEPGDICINGSDLALPGKGSLIKPDFSERFETKLLGEHNQRNCALALAAAFALGLDEEEVRDHIATFDPLPYRLEKVGVFGGRTFYDDSLATIPEATLASLHSLPRVDTLILGGEDRGIPFGDFADALAKTDVETFVIFPDTGEKMIARVSDRRVIRAASMEEAVKAAYAHTPQGGTVLLSNASPSFNMFNDYKDKSAQYRSCIKTLESGTA
jgi:UDP-N-acetylmuramoylalanine--D-glutamate ligase